MASYFFCGVGGSGMSPLAQTMLSLGHTVKGSDRSYDQGKTLQKFEALKKLGIGIHPQDGSGVKQGDIIVASTAVDDRDKIPDIEKARELGLTIMKRSELLADVFNASQTGVAIGGTSGKSTVTAMVGHILKQVGKQPTVVNGAPMKNSTDGLGNVILGGNRDLTVIEADESDGSIAGYTPSVATLLNIGEDHKSLDELYKLFGDFVGKASIGSVINLDCTHSAKVKQYAHNVHTFSTENETADFYAENITPTATGSVFNVQKKPVKLSVPGKHNVANALAALATVTHLNIALKDAITALESFSGVKRRLETLGVKNDITVIDDFGHNPDKITASLNTLNEHNGRFILIFQAHGFTPAKNMKDDLIQIISRHLKPEDMFIMPEIYYAGKGHVNRSISSKDIIEPIQKNGVQAHFFEERRDVKDFILANAKSGDRIVIMGARDDTLTEFALDILENI